MHAASESGSGSGGGFTAPPEPSPTGRRFLLWMTQADCADVAGCAEPHHGKARNWLLKGATDSAAGPDLSNIHTPRSNNRDLSHVYLNDDLDIPVVELIVQVHMGQITVI